MDSLPAENNIFKVLDSQLKATTENQPLSKMVLKECVVSFSHSAKTNGEKPGSNKMDYLIDDQMGTEKKAKKLN